MKKSILKLGKTLNKVEQRNVNGGDSYQWCLERYTRYLNRGSYQGAPNAPGHAGQHPGQCRCAVVYGFPEEVCY
ncbi:hypothetical protein ABW636_04405 [Aquimarina sp. 2201CG1-2-11]|uniref:hypothetical protein n=1 Tax=Aquimarina discodermiae TaxID=3231043 RepID=UPI00346342CF